ncbi:MAG: hypothetical protein ACI9MS_000563 [Glaciecola sp.]|jgi:hypothetical protein
MIFINFVTKDQGHKDKVIKTTYNRKYEKIKKQQRYHCTE